MIRTPAILFALLVTATAVPSAKAGGSVNIKCAPNEDRVWVYESLTDFNVAAKLKCGDPVQIVERVKGYVKIQTANGTEGYVLDTSFPKSALPPAPVEKPNDVESAAAAFAAKRGVRAPDNSGATPASARSSAPAVAASVPQPAAVASSVPGAVVNPAAPSQPAPQTTITLSAAASTSPVNEPVRSVPAAATTPPTPAAPVIAKNSTPAANTNTVVVENIAPAAPANVAYKTPERAPAPQPVPQPPAQPAAVTVAAAPPPRANPVIAVSTPTPAVATAAKAPAVVPVSNPAPVATVSTASVSAPAPAPSEANDASSMTIETVTTSASLQPVADATPPRAPIIAVKPAAKRPVNPDGDVDSEVDALNSDTANCTQYFSAYGLSANQYKWLAQNRQKAFPSVCPAPSPAQVDFVVIFTHDVAFYNATMPDAVHTDLNGFSDWTPLTTVDTAQISASDADKSHHEYVWVFHTTRGAFDPAKFSARRRPLYSKAETNMLGSRGGFRTVMDALTFIEQNGTSR
jgi:Bacterial SH3 domain